MKLPPSAPAFLASVAVLLTLPAQLTAETREEMIRRMHGGTAPAKVSDQAAAVSFADGVENSAPVGAFLSALATGLKTRDPKPVQALLSAKYTIEGLPPEAPQSPSDILGQAITQVSGPNAMIVTSLKRAEGELTAKVNFKFANRVTSKVFVFDAQGHLLRTDFFKIGTQPHGTPPPTAENPAAPPAASPVPIAPAPAAPTKISFAPGVREVPKLADYFARFGAAVANRDAGGLPGLSPEFAITGLSVAEAPEFFKQAVAEFGGTIDEITVTGFEHDATDLLVHLTLTMGRSRAARTFRFDTESRLKGADFIFDLRSPHPRPEHAAMPDRVEVAAQQLGTGVLWVEAEVNGRRGYFLFDTGAARVVLNETIFGDLRNPGEVAVARSATGAFAGHRARVDKLRIGDFEIGGFDAGLSKLDHIGRGFTVFGLIGQDAIKDCEIVFDYAGEKITLYALAADGKPKAANPLGAPKNTVAFELERSIPIFPAEVNGQRIRLGLDSGAATNIIDQNLRAKITGSEAAPSGGGQLTSASGAVAAQGFASAKVKLEGSVEFTGILAFVDIAHFRSGGSSTWDALTGFDLLSPQPAAINYQTKQLKFW